MQGSFTEKSISNFLKDLKTGKASMSPLKTKIVIKNALTWDGKDAPSMPDDESDYDDEI